MPKNLIKRSGDDFAIALHDDWQFVQLPAVLEEVKKQAGKVVLFKLTNAESGTAEQIAATEVPATGKVVLPLSLWLARKAEFAERVSHGEVGIWLETHELVETLFESQPDLNVFPLIGVHIERHPDGRAYSTASLLRTRYGFRHELRAFGDVLRDQLFFLRRCGFSEFQIRSDRSAQDALASLKDFSEPYQAAVVVDQPLWRRHSRA